MGAHDRSDSFSLRLLQSQTGPFSTVDFECMPNCRNLRVKKLSRDVGSTGSERNYDFSFTRTADFGVVKKGMARL